VLRRTDGEEQGCLEGRSRGWAERCLMQLGPAPCLVSWGQRESLQWVWLCWLPSCPAFQNASDNTYAGVCAGSAGRKGHSFWLSTFSHSGQVLGRRGDGDRNQSQDIVLVWAVFPTFSDPQWHKRTHWTVEHHVDFWCFLHLDSGFEHQNGVRLSPTLCEVFQRRQRTRVSLWVVRAQS
jgi:hypothetical protein